MTTVSIIGNGNMGTAIGSLAAEGGHTVEFIDRQSTAISGDIVVLAVPYPSVAGIIADRASALAGRIVVDITNPLDFETFDGLVVPSDGSAASVIAEALPESTVLKAFNTNFAGTLAAKSVGDSRVTVLIAGDDDTAKRLLSSVLKDAGVAAVDAGSLKRARELEAIGFLQLTLAAQEKISWTGGFALVG
ncbi:MULTISPECIES: NADPH-dependent F420 reductase [unclassified Leifsonia]|uniref:NADPH-dependent F420 reductase n=1 Tax=unclassified Leifsonia TaxID=2663824 RepID=UPI0006F83185|nr:MULTISPECIES: NADPH-dependent F420 reductase [unclassified Leifsonia]KQX05191.1 diguanylate cyclase [Leifsonia sp. Root1293]KRA08824.1 diguanylate cyclase [Leifsonia sp. Root60]